MRTPKITPKRKRHGAQPASHKILHLGVTSTVKSFLNFCCVFVQMFQRNSSYVLAIFLGNFGLGLLHTAFNFYYVKVILYPLQFHRFIFLQVFLNIFQVNEYWFNLAQLLFLIWNAINDPLFGYLQVGIYSELFFNLNSQDVGGTWMQSRARIFTYFGPFFVISFLITWFPWGNKDSPPYVEGLHLIVSLFFYDAFFRFFFNFFHISQPKNWVESR